MYPYEPSYDFNFHDSSDDLDLEHTLGYALPPFDSELKFDGIDPVLRQRDSLSPCEESSESSSSDEGYSQGSSTPSQSSSSEPAALSDESRVDWSNLVDYLVANHKIKPEDAPSSLSPPNSRRSVSPESTMSLPNRKRRRQSSSSLFSIDESDDDDDDDDKDGDYKPDSDPEATFVRTGSRKRRRSSAAFVPDIVEKKSRISGPKRPAPLAARPTIKLPSVKIGRARPSSTRTRAAAASRNQKSKDPAMIALIWAKLKLTKAQIDDYTCPQCAWVQRNSRVPDYKRHLRTHLPNEYDFQCCGVPLREAALHGIPADAVPFMYDGELRVGGCLTTFSRIDALKRHIGAQSYNGGYRCVCDVIRKRQNIYQP